MTVPIGWSHALLFAAVALAVRAITFGHPFVGFDEQFYLLVGDRMVREGAVPFVDIWDRKPVGLFLIYGAIRLLGGQGIWQYQLVATTVLAGTAWLLARFAASYTSRAAATWAGIALILWMNLGSGEGGQAPIFYNPLMLGAGVLVVRAGVAGRPPLLPGLLAMALVGLALQIKYTVVFEGVFFGLVLLWCQWRRSPALLPLAGHALAWVVVALVPTLLVAGWYWRIGAWDAFWFANFQSLAARGQDAASIVAGRFLLLWLIVAPLAALAWSVRNERSAVLPFVRLWFIVASLAVLVFGTWFDHYALPIIPPALLAAVPAWDRRDLRRWVIGITAVVALLGQFIAARHTARRGRDAEAQALLALTKDSRNCPWFYDGQPALYLLGDFCLPTRWPFLGHLNQATEANAVGADTSAEVTRILAGRPDIIVTREPGFNRENLASRRLVYQTLGRDYLLRGRVPTASRVYAVYRLRPGLAPLPNAWPRWHATRATPAPSSQPPSTSLGQ